MGYDLYVERPPHQYVEAMAQWENTDFSSHEYQQIRETVATLEREFRLYFRANMWAMGNLTRELAAQGALEQVPLPAFPKYKRAWASIDAEILELDPDYQDYAKGCDTIRDAPGSRRGVIPSYKLSTNDGWLVTPEEIRGALTRLRREPVTRPGDWETGPWAEYWSRFMDFLEVAAERGGFRVW